jgi:hypothetical protein
MGGHAQAATRQLPAAPTGRGPRPVRVPLTAEEMQRWQATDWDELEELAAQLAQGEVQLPEILQEFERHIQAQLATCKEVEELEVYR